MKYTILTLLSLLLFSCSSNFVNPNSLEREVSSEINCNDLIETFFKPEKYNEDELNKALIEKKLIKFTDKIITINYPRIDHLNRIKSNLINRVKSWNVNEYPLFYMDAKEQILPFAKQYASLIEKELDGSLDENETLALSSINEWISNFSSYKKDLDNLLEERVSYQFNLNMLKNLKIKDNEKRDIKISIKVNGEMQNEIITLRKDESNISYQVKLLKIKIKNFDGPRGSVGKIEERILQQAMLNDIITILHRELEYGIKNGDNVRPELKVKLLELEKTLANNSFKPSTYGIYKINDKKFKIEISDMIRLNKSPSKNVNLNVLNFIKKIFNLKPREKIKEVLSNSTNSITTNTPKPTGTVVSDQIPPIGDTSEEKNLVPIKETLNKIYAKVSTIGPYQSAKKLSAVGIIGVSSYQYFSFKKTSDTEVSPSQGPSPSVNPEPDIIQINPAMPMDVHIHTLEELKSLDYSEGVDLGLEEIRKEFN